MYVFILVKIFFYLHSEHVIIIIVVVFKLRGMTFQKKKIKYTHLG